MQKKLLAVAVAGALVAPAAFAQTSVTISGALNLWYESAAATGATVGRPGDILSRDRIVDGAGSNIRFTVVEDLGSGMQAFGQVESGVLNNADARANAVGASSPGTPTGLQGAGGWATRNSGVGLRSSAWGEVLLGIWDVHYNEQYAVDDHIIKGSSNSSTLGLFNTLGTQGNMSVSPTVGARYSNVIRYQSPSWSGFNFKVAYARPTDGVPPNTQVLATGLTDITDGKKNQMWNFAPQYSNGPIFVGWSHIVDKDIIATTTAAPVFFAGSAIASTAAAIPALGVNTIMKVTGDRLMGAYTLPMGLRIALVWDRSKLTMDNAGGAGTATNNSAITRDAWAIPLSYTTGAHTAYATYGKAKNWKGNINGVDVGSITVTAPAAAGGTVNTVGSATGAKMWMFGYQYALSKRTNIHLTYAKITNDNLAGYDFFSTNVGMTGTATATQGASYGADPRVYSIGLRHAF